MDPDLAACQVIILSPSRELAGQSSVIFKALSDYMNLNSVMVVGGLARGEMTRTLKGAQAVVGTPGRVYDMMQSRAIDTANVRLLILDEADEMLSVGFQDQVCVS